MTQQPTTTAAATQSIPAEATQLAAANQLGTPTAVYKAGIPAFELVMSIVFLLLGVGWVALILSHGTDNGGLIGAIIGFILIGGWGLLWPIRQLLNRSLRVYVCTEGLLWMRGSKTVAIRWDQVE